jgi:ankyrin repeat protein
MSPFTSVMKEGLTPLHFASMEKVAQWKTELASMLLEKGAEINAKTEVL